MDLTSSVLASPGAPVMRQWPLYEQGDQQLLNHLLLADDYFGQFRLNAGAARDDLLDGRFFRGNLV